MEDYPDSKDKQLIKALCALTSEKDVENFLRDLLTLSEIKEFSNRLFIARLLYEGKHSYKEIAEKAGTSTTTVTRVNEWLNKKGLNGYKKALKNIL